MKAFKLPTITAASLLGNLGMDDKPSSGFSFDLGDAGSLDLSPPPMFTNPPKPVPTRVPGVQEMPDDGHGHGGAKPLPWSPSAPVSMKNMINTSTYRGAGTHITDGLDMNKGRKTAVDIMAKPGTPVGAPANGVVQRLGSAQGGQSMYFRADNGRVYWMGHIDGRYSLPAGTRVKAGQMLSRISADHPAPHLHMDASW